MKLDFLLSMALAAGLAFTPAYSQDDDEEADAALLAPDAQAMTDKDSQS